MELGLGPGDFVLDGDPAALPKKEAEPPQMGSQLSAKEAQQPPSFWPIPIVATVAHLSYG